MFSAGATESGQLAASQTPIFTVPALTVSYIKQVFLFNTDAADQTIQLWIDDGGGARKWHRLVLAENESTDILEHGETITLPAGSTIEAVSTDGSVVDFVVTAINET